MNQNEHFVVAIFVWLCMTSFGVMILGFQFFLENLVLPLMGLIFTVTTALLPDTIEPANSPYHRGFFHSIQVLLFLMLCFVIFMVFLTPLTLLGLYTISGYLSHLLLDATTPRGLPSWKIT
jgi:membrane-bound metal-dependent hydrolase YbcI (DUF457 family)